MTDRDVQLLDDVLNGRCMYCRDTGLSLVPFHEVGICTCKFCRCPLGCEMPRDDADEELVP